MNSMRQVSFRTARLLRCSIPGSSGGRWVTGHATAASANGPWTKDANAIISPDATGWEASFDSTDYVAGVLDAIAGHGESFTQQVADYQVGFVTLSNQAQLTFNLLNATLTVGGNKTIYIDLNSVVNMYGYQFQVNYDASKVSATAAFVNRFDTTGQFIPGGWNANCVAGVCQFAVTRQRGGKRR